MQPLHLWVVKLPTLSGSIKYSEIGMPYYIALLTTDTEEG